MVCAAFSKFYVQIAIKTLVASLGACFASLGRAYACTHMFEAVQNDSWRADLLGLTFVEATDEMPPYILYMMLCMYLHINI